MHGEHRTTLYQVEKPARHRRVSGETSGHDIVLGEYEIFCRAAGMSGRTIRLRLQWLRRVARDIDLTSATRADLLGWLGRHRWQPETRKSARSALRSFYRWAVDENLVEQDPTMRLPAVRVPPGVPRPAPTPLLQRAMAAASERDQLIIGLAAFAGARRTEIAELTWTAVEWHGLRIVGKGGRTRLVPWLPRLRDLLAAERRRRELGRVGVGWRYEVDPSSPYVLPSHMGRHMSPDTVGSILSAALGPNWSGHTLRHRFLTKAYAVEQDLLAVQQLAGHSKPETTARYVELPLGALSRAVAGAAA